MARPTVPDPTRVASKWVRRAGQAASDYVEGATTTTKDQAAAARAQKTLWIQRLGDKLVQDLWDKRLQQVGTEGWKAGVREKGSARYGPGVGASEAKFGGRISGILAAIASVDLKARGLPASEDNFGRSRAIGVALNKLKGTFAR